MPDYTKFIAFIEARIADDSGYDEAAWPAVKKLLIEAGAIRPEPEQAMSGAKHTPEPWVYAEGGKYPEIYSSGGILICDWDDRNDCVEAPSTEDGERIVACVNACKGIPTEALEFGVVMVMTSAAEKTDA